MISGPTLAASDTWKMLPALEHNGSCRSSIVNFEHHGNGPLTTLVFGPNSGGDGVSFGLRISTLAQLDVGSVTKVFGTSSTSAWRTRLEFVTDQSHFVAHDIFRVPISRQKKSIVIPTLIFDGSRLRLGRIHQRTGHGHLSAAEVPERPVAQNILPRELSSDRGWLKRDKGFASGVLLLTTENARRARRTLRRLGVRHR